MNKSIVSLDHHSRLLCYQDKEFCQQLYQYVLSLDESHFETLKSNQRSIVKKFSFHNQLYIFKIPLEKNQRKWIRFTTLYRKSEAERSLDTMQQLINMGFHTTKPVLAFLKSQHRMITDSFTIYEYLTAKPVDKTHLPQIIKVLHALHQKSFIHNDPHAENFLHSDHQLFLIDANIKKIFFFKDLRFAFEFVYLSQMNPESKAFLSKESHTLSFKIATLYFHYLNLWRKFKRVVRRKKYEKSN